VESLAGSPWADPSPGDRFSRADVVLLAPCAPGKIVCVGKNYREHAAEMKGLSGDGSVPSEPLLFLKPPSAVVACGDPILYPPQSERVDYEGELAVVIGRSCRRVTPEEALDYIFGYTVANDVTARDLQQRDRQWTRAKGFDTFCPLGPVLVTDLAADAQLTTRLNGEIVQDSPIDRMVFPPAFLVSYISQVMTLEPGDLVLTGTPSGVGPLQPGDTVSVEIAGIGKLTNPISN
jgi:2-keto-4-pentenoate hydratase/2-oxohepta-3-ene-1,7-dioic acid hydratase in catechol pathway